MFFRVLLFYYIIFAKKLQNRKFTKNQTSITKTYNVTEKVAGEFATAWASYCNNNFLVLVSFIDFTYYSFIHGLTGLFIVFTKFLHWILFIAFENFLHGLLGPFVFTEFLHGFLWPSLFHLQSFIWFVSSPLLHLKCFTWFIRPSLLHLYCFSWFIGSALLHLHCFSWFIGPSLLHLYCFSWFIGPTLFQL